MLDRTQIKLDVKAYMKGKAGSFALVVLITFAIWMAVGIIPIAGLLLGLAMLPMMVSLFGYSLRFARGDNPAVGELFNFFSDRYLPYLGTMLWFYLMMILSMIPYCAFFAWMAIAKTFIGAWSLIGIALIIPCYILCFAMLFSPFIIFENPKLGGIKAFKMSLAITKGHKWELFVLTLSFLGWLLLGVLTLFILTIVYVYPYYLTTLAVYYEKLKAAAIAEGKVDPADFGVVLA